MTKKLLFVFTIICCLMLIFQACGLKNDPDVDLAAQIDKPEPDVSIFWETPLSQEISQPLTSELPSEEPSSVAVSFPADVAKNPQFIADPKKAPEEDPQYAKEQQKKQQEPARDTLPPAPPPPPPVSATTTTSAVTSPPPIVTSILSSDLSSTFSSIIPTSLPPVTTSAKPPPPLNGWHVDEGKTYFYNNGTAVKGYQTMSGVRYFFDAAGVLSSKVGIDVSYYQGNINWTEVKNAGVDFVMIRVGFRGWGSAGSLLIDNRFVASITGANAAGLQCGVYFYSQAITVAEAVEEAQFTLAAIKGYQLTYPVAYDIEDAEAAGARTNGLTNQQRTDFSAAFCDTIKSAGYTPMVYSNKHWLETKLDMNRLSVYDTWLAHYATTTNYARSFTMWQYTSTGRVNGITGNVDRNVGLFDYAAK